MIGTWFDGSAKRDVEEAIWISPRLLSRWIGYAGAREKWTLEERRVRWEMARRVAQEKAIVVVRIASYPKVDPLAPDEENRPDLRDFERLRILFTADGREIPVRQRWEGTAPFVQRRIPPSDWDVQAVEAGAGPIADLRSRNRAEVERFPWHQLTPFVEAFSPTFPEEFPPSWGGYFGNYRAKWIWVEADFASRQWPRRQFEVRILSPRKERTAVFAIR